MHATLEQLLALRDGKAEGFVQAHVGACAECQTEASRLVDLKGAMRALPEVEPPTGTWSGIVEAAKRQEASSTQRIGWAIAASVLMVALLAGSLSGRNKAPEAVLSAENTGSVTAEPDIETLISRSQQLESVLQSLPRRPAVVRARTDGTIASLTNSIAMVDYSLSVPDARLTEQQSKQLWQQRVGLMDSLVKVRYAEASQATL